VAERYSTCARRSRRTTTRSSSMSATRRPWKITSNLPYAHFLVSQFARLFSVDSTFIFCRLWWILTALEDMVGRLWVVNNFPLFLERLDRFLSQDSVYADFL
jgi:hypothetical protein